MYEIDFLKDKTDYLAKEISKQRTEEIICFFG